MLTRKILIIFTALLIISCGGGGSGSSDTVTTDTVTTDTVTTDTVTTDTVTTDTVTTDTVTTDTVTTDTVTTDTVTTDTVTTDTVTTDTVTTDTVTTDTVTTDTVTTDTVTTDTVTTLTLASQSVTILEDETHTFIVDKSQVIKDSKGDVVENASDFVLTIFSEPANGDITVISNTSFHYTPNSDFYGEDRVDYQLCHIVECYDSQVNLSISPVYDFPMSANDSVVALTETVTVEVLENDVLDGVFNSLAIVTSPLHGTATINATSIQYEEYTYQTGLKDMLVYEVCDLVENCATATLTIQPFELVTSAVTVRVATQSNPGSSDELFTNKSQPLDFNHLTHVGEFTQESVLSAGGIAAVDINNDEYYDVFLSAGRSSSTSLLINNEGDSFTERASNYNLSLQGDYTQPFFLDVDGDTDKDLLFARVDNNLRVFENHNNTFLSMNSNLSQNSAGVYGINAGDFNQDSELDLFFTGWNITEQSSLWYKSGENFVLKDESLLSNVKDNIVNERHNQTCDEQNSYSGSFFGFTPNIVDVNNDFRSDILAASDFASSYMLLNQQDTFNLNENVDFTDCNAMGSAIADYDNDGDMDWFVSSIRDADGAQGNWGINGNRLYRNDNGRFVDVSEAAGITDGSWGWGSCFADFNNDQYVDIFHVNGIMISSFNVSEFDFDTSRLFISNKDGTFSEASSDWGIEDDAQGRGIICFDYDRDGDIDIAINNANAPNGAPGSAALWHNNSRELVSATTTNFINIKVLGDDSAPLALGAIIVVKTGSLSQTKEVRYENGFMSQPPLEMHFGLANNDTVDEIIIYWPAPFYKVSILHNIPANQFISISY